MTSLSAENMTLKVGERTLIGAMNMVFSPGECWAILGGNGSGKTTLLHTLAGLTTATNGECLLGDSPLLSLSRRYIATKIGLLLQDIHDPFPTTVIETALTGRHPHLGRWQQEGESDFTLAQEALAQMDLAGLERRMVQTLSGGERRRLAIATLLTQATQILLLDEPFNHLDLHHQQQLLKYLGRLAQSGRTVIMVLHDPNQALRHCDHALLLYGDGNWEGGECEDLLTSERLSKLYRHPIRLLQQGDERYFTPAE